MEQYLSDVSSTVSSKIKSGFSNTYDTLGAIIATAPGYPVSSGGNDISQAAASIRKRRQSPVEVNDSFSTSHANSSSSRAPSRPTPSMRRPSASIRESSFDQGSSPIKVSSRNTRAATGIASIPANLSKISSTNRHSVLHQDHTRKGGTGFQSEAPEVSTVKPPQNKKRKVDNVPPLNIAAMARPLPNRSEREQQTKATASTHPFENGKHGQSGPVQYGKGAANSNRRRGMIDLKGKGKAVEPKTPEVIEIDLESEEETENPPQPAPQPKSLAALMSAGVITSAQIPPQQNPFTASMGNEVVPASQFTLEKLQPTVSPRLPFSEHILAAASPILVQSSASQDHASRPDSPQHRILPETTTKGTVECSRRHLLESEIINFQRDITEMNPTIPVTMLATGRGPQSHITYAQRLPPQPPSPSPSPLPLSKLKPRSPSPCMFQGDGRPVFRPVLARPEWVDNPPYIGEKELVLVRQIPQRLLLNLVALADEMDERGENPQRFRLEQYLEFRGWTHQIIPSFNDSAGSALNAQHVWAAQKCWRAIKSVDIREAEARGLVVFPSDQATTTQADASNVAEETPSASTSAKGPVPVVPTTPPPLTMTIPEESPEFSVQPTPLKITENADRIESPGPSAGQQQQQRDDIQSPERMNIMDADLSPSAEDPIEDNDETDEIQCIG